MSKKEASFGSWPSAFSAEAIAGSTLRFGQIQADGDTLYWTEMRPLEGGRSAIVRCGHDGVVSDVVAPPYSARSRIHEYGGGELLVAEGTIYFVNGEDQDIYAVPPDGGVTRLTDAPDTRFGDMTLDVRRNRLICVAERYTGEHDPMPANLLVAVALDGDMADEDREPFTVLVSGNDFYSSPALNAEGSQLAWLEWSLPSMPWEGATLTVADLDDAGMPGSTETVAGGDGSAAFQPRWSHDGNLVFVWNGSGWGNLHQWDGTQAKALVEHAAEFAHPQWALGMRSFALLPDGCVFASFMEQGAFKSATITPGSNVLTQIDCEARSFQVVTTFGSSVAALATFDDRPSALVVIENLQGPDAVIRTIRPSASIKVEAGDVSVGQAVSFASETGGVAYATYYQPTNAGYRGPASERPPAIVLVHGGPTGSADRGFKPKTQYWTSRGFAVIDVDFTGSFGYGRAYREALNGAWGTADGADAAAAARWLIGNGLADGEKIAISGGSSGGYTALCALMNHDVFAAAAVYYGISDVALLARSTHKFESGYVSTLTALPQDAPEEAYRPLSPVHNAERIKSPVILFQGLEDRVVPPDQSEAIAEELGNRGIPVSYLAFEGEAHGFRSADTLIEATRSEHAFFARIMDLNPADELPELDIRNVDLAGMRFGSDNSFGVPDQMIEALASANGGTMASYGADEISNAVQRRLCETFECDLKMFLVATGTAANALSLSAITPPYGAVLCHPESHIVVDECGAPEFYTGGAKLVGVPGEDGKVDAEILATTAKGFVTGEQHQVQLASLSLTQATEAGTVYSASEIAALTEIARSRSMKVHMDGARFANAVASGAGTPAELTWKAGVDVLSFGATKNGAIAAEAVVLFDQTLAGEVMFRRKRGGHLISKSRFVAAQFDAYLRDGLWLDLARHANDMARRLGDGIARLPSARLAYPVEANEVFVILPRPVHAGLQAGGAYYYEWPGAGPSGAHAVGADEILVRLVTSFETPVSDVDEFLTLLSTLTVEA